jgi:hypothetical protein
VTWITPAPLKDKAGFTVSNEPLLIRLTAWTACAEVAETASMPIAIMGTMFLIVGPFILA